MNIDATDKDATAKLAQWFTDRWEAKFSLSITAEIIELIEKSWASEEQPTPYEMTPLGDGMGAFVGNPSDRDVSNAYLCAYDFVAFGSHRLDELSGAIDPPT